MDPPAGFYGGGYDRKLIILLIFLLSILPLAFALSHSPLPGPGQTSPCTVSSQVVHVCV